MRIARIQHDGAERVGIVRDDHIDVLDESVSVLRLLSAEPAERDRLADAPVTQRALAGAQLLAPLNPPTLRDFSVFESHIEGAVMASYGPAATVPDFWYERPYCYFSNPYAVSGYGDEVAMAPGTRLQDFELEVAAVIGRSGFNLRPDQARDHIAGVTIWNDWTARDIGSVEVATPFGQCKAKDFANTLGPWIVTLDELEPYRVGDRYQLAMSASINGTPLGDGDTLANMAWSFEDMVSYASRGTWVRPGDVLGSGTCGNGCLLESWGRNQDFTAPPPLQPGDEVTLTVEGIGSLTNTLIASPDPYELPPARRVTTASTDWRGR